MEHELSVLVLGSLLHDIGKFAQRAKRPYSKNMEGEYLTYSNGKQGHWHTLYSDYFIENDLPLPKEMEHLRSTIARTASAHHRPDENRLPEMCVMIADRLSSGSDRIPDDDQDDSDFRKSRLISVFDEIELLSHQFQAPGNAFYRLAPLTSGSEDSFPVKGPPSGSAEEYEGLFNLFLNEIRQVNTECGFRFYLETIIALLEKYTWCIPSSTYKTLSDVSLFDHSMMTAGIAQALFVHHKQQNSIPKWQDSAPKCMLTGGDLSGIQNYIFDISRDKGKGVSKMFRARSFYLQAAAESVLLDIQRRLNLFSVFRLVDSGGKFILILPLTDDIQKTMKAVEEDIQFWFFKKFKGLLTLSISDPVLMTQKDFLMSNFQQKMDELSHAIEASKFRKLHAALKRQGPVISEGYDEHENGNCAVCQTNAADQSSTQRYIQQAGFEQGDAVSICSDCFVQMDYIGKKLPSSVYILYGEDAGTVPLFGNIRLSLAEQPPSNLSGLVQAECMEDSVNFKKKRLARYLPKITLEELKDPNWFELFEKEQQGQPLESDQPKTFGMIAHKSKKSAKDGTLTGRSLLGFFKADVDNLGLIFSTGLKKKMSASRFLMTSRMLDLFFSEYLVKLAKKEYPDIYVVFAGGDDLFLVGPWWQIIQFGVKLRKKFFQFCAENPDITMSAGILAAKPRLPMRKAAEMVEGQLDMAKEHESSDRIKDSVCFLNETLSWDELDRLMSVGSVLDKSVEEKDRTNFTTAFLYRLLQYHRMYRKFKYDRIIQYGRYLALAHYDIGRNICDPKKENQKEIDFLRKIFVVGVKERPELEKLNIPLFYAINLNRTSD